MASTSTEPFKQQRTQANNVILLGPEKVGKTRLLERIIMKPEKYRYDETYTATIGGNCVGKRFLRPTHSFKFWFTDTAGRPDYRTIISSYFSNQQQVMLVFDITNRNGFFALRGFVNDINAVHEKRRGVYSVKPRFIVVGNKADVAQARQVSPEEAQKYAKELNAQYFEVSVKTGDGIENLREHQIELAKQYKITVDSAAAAAELASAEFFDKNKAYAQDLQERGLLYRALSCLYNAFTSCWPSRSRQGERAPINTGSSSSSSSSQQKGGYRSVANITSSDESDESDELKVVKALSSQQKGGYQSVANITSSDEPDELKVVNALIQSLQERNDFIYPESYTARRNIASVLRFVVDNPNATTDNLISVVDRERGQNTDDCRKESDQPVDEFLQGYFESQLNILQKEPASVLNSIQNAFATMFSYFYDQQRKDENVSQRGNKGLFFARGPKQQAEQAVELFTKYRKSSRNE